MTHISNQCLLTKPRSPEMSIEMSLASLEGSQQFKTNLFQAGRRFNIVIITEYNDSLETTMGIQD